MRNILEFLFIIGATWLVLDITFYSPKYQIKRLWKEVFRNAEEEEKITKKSEGKDLFAYEGIFSLFKSRSDRAGKLINALLDYHFPDTMENQEYLEENKYEKD